MSPDRDLATTSPPSRQDLATVPERPQIEPGEMYTGGPFVLEMHPVEASWKHSIGWMQRSERRGGPCFVIVRSTFTGSIRIVERFPLTDAGWSRAWKALVRLDRDGAAMALDVLTARARLAASKAALAEMAAQSISVLTDVRYIPGSGKLPDIASGSRLDVRFLADQVVFGARRLAAGAGRIQLSRRGRRRGRRARPGPALDPGSAGGPGAGLRPRGRDAGQPGDPGQDRRPGRDRECELFVVDSQTEPDVLRMRLSPALWAIREAREAAGRPGAGGAPAPGDAPAAGAGGAASVVDQLAKLAGLLESGLLTREEFDRLKGGLLEGP